MGQKSNPNGLRLGIIRTWESKWYDVDKKVPFLVGEDFKIRTLIKNHYPKSTISQIEIKRLKKSNDEFIEIDLYTSKIGIIQGPENKNKNSLINKIEKLINKKVQINIFEVKAINKIAVLVAQNIAMQLQQRAFYKAVLKSAIQKALKSGIKGIKIIITGRLGGAEKARRDSISMGVVPLNTLRADIDYAFEEAHTTYGVLGVKVIINHGEVLPNKTIADTRQIFSSQYENKKNNNKRHFVDKKNFKKSTS
ncbi:MAG: 30S ribosomal protein S3 [Candidatus Phytoplasma vitis]|uniref:Small ribosomal subunit protein uS3 n=13 Tax=Candidatus Phytoplasma TaxID=33926 RepID=RS3_PHYVT|nr:RecName: Full=Small ribosomal subunit protein uS3; AltName: Full=30S ribosomal protein S3 [Candidatus Phytoplasma vitis]AFN02594.1 ribosomal protein S3 ['Vitis vinifera' yellows phytoplasma]QCW07230.1 ribosomal protein S3 ['Alnus glutinosa' phytoplasma]QCW07232.1 ribosomal protein S3 ['Artemisia vulgaris' phytoplasma]QEN95729.1 ribosomal protein S3 ['Corylus avellana' phytoplasma D876/17]QUW17325.1 ribosomal protein S3 ['Ulmus parvifolia' phytoplasma]